MRAGHIVGDEDLPGLSDWQAIDRAVDSFSARKKEHLDGFEVWDGSGTVIQIPAPDTSEPLEPVHGEDYRRTSEVRFIPDRKQCRRPWERNRLPVAGLISPGRSPSRRSLGLTLIDVPRGSQRRKRCGAIKFRYYGSFARCDIFKRLFGCGPHYQVTSLRMRFFTF